MISVTKRIVVCTSNCGPALL